ncbi:replication protein A 14 kDa subunit [Loxodonta africana]|uniref:replication protein A 14 kDa subunit n=1 Tax=Loxodonta africana TaxID=9785 RepID=UPI0030CD56B9
MTPLRLWQIHRLTPTTPRRKPGPNPRLVLPPLCPRGDENVGRHRRLPREEVPVAFAAVPRRTGTVARHPTSGVKSHRGSQGIAAGKPQTPPHPSSAPLSRPGQLPGRRTSLSSRSPLPDASFSLPTRSGDSTRSVDVSARLIGGPGGLVFADWCRGNLPHRRPRAHRFSCRLFPARWKFCVAIVVDLMELPKSRINASMLAQFIDRPVCFVGKLEKIHPSGKMFVLSDGEGKNGTIELMEPLEEEISGIVEVVGRVTAKATIMCSSYVQFREDNHPFDLGLYNEAIKIIQEFPHFFPLGVVQYD